MTFPTFAAKVGNPSHYDCDSSEFGDGVMLMRRVWLFSLGSEKWSENKQVLSSCCS